MQLSPCHRIACTKGAPQVIGSCLTTLFAPTAVGDTEGEIGATLLVLSSLKHMKCPQTYTSFPGTGETVTVENRDVFVEATWTYSRRRIWTPSINRRIWTPSINGKEVRKENMDTQH
ncbi:hypothetical protein AYI77_05600 [Shewanella algae]|nr:hypothetical protein AYI77_05600 [Shewanella algae]